ncbi:MAG: hypothetical protein JKY34_07465 [Kordiimonadaceae bacterium]|nr:hypothetical protein [Kordiimonadaceae bacterium]
MKLMENEKRRSRIIGFIRIMSFIGFILAVGFILLVVLDYAIDERHKAGVGFFVAMLLSPFYLLYMVIGEVGMSIILGAPIITFLSCNLVCMKNKIKYGIWCLEKPSKTSVNFGRRAFGESRVDRVFVFQKAGKYKHQSYIKGEIDQFIERNKLKVSADDFSWKRDENWNFVVSVTLTNPEDVLRSLLGLQVGD